MQYRVDGDDVVRSTDERLFLVNANDHIATTSTSSATDTAAASSDISGEQCLGAMC